jgi:hypothetical protein
MITGIALSGRLKLKYGSIGRARKMTLPGEPHDNGPRQ